MFQILYTPQTVISSVELVFEVYTIAYDKICFYYDISNFMVVIA